MILSWTLWILALWSFISSCGGSYGDRTLAYRKCLQICLDARCSTPASKNNFLSSQPWPLVLLGWDCRAECGYDCMWEAVDVLASQGEAVPQFDGKWPFVRVIGVQEPASAIASVLNGVCHFLMLRRFTRIVPSTTPFFNLWRLFSVVCINAWVWSFVFHVRDTPWTERFDYFSAFSLILVQLFCSLVRIVGESPIRLPASIGFVLGGIFLHHCLTMSFVDFDYGYNMKVNIFFAGVFVLVWTSYTVLQIVKGYTHFWKALIATIWFSASALLETLDFPPIFWAVDSHALWHFSTAPLPLLFYDFVIDDCGLLLKKHSRAGTNPFSYKLEMDLASKRD